MRLTNPNSKKSRVFKREMNGIWPNSILLASHRSSSSSSSLRGMLKCAHAKVVDKTGVNACTIYIYLSRSLGMRDDNDAMLEIVYFNNRSRQQSTSRASVKWDENKGGRVGRNVNDKTLEYTKVTRKWDKKFMENFLNLFFYNWTFSLLNVNLESCQ